MPCLVISGALLLFVAHHHRFPLCAHQDLVLGELEIDVHDDLAVLPRRVQRRFVNKVCQIRSSESGCPTGKYGQIDVVTERNFLSVNFEDRFPS